MKIIFKKAQVKKGTQTVFNQEKYLKINQAIIEKTGQANPMKISWFPIDDESSNWLYPIGNQYVRCQ